MSGKHPFAIVIDGTTVLPHATRREFAPFRAGVQ